MLLQIEGIPLADHASNGGRSVVAAEESEGGATGAGVDVHEQDSPTIARPVNIGRHEGVLRVGWIPRRVAVQQLPFLIVERTHPMQGLTEVDRKILAVAAPET